MRIRGDAEDAIRLEVGSDPSDNEVSEVSLEFQLSLLQATLDSTQDGILVVDRGGRIVRSNQRLITMWGIPEEIVATQDVKRAIEYFRSQVSDPKRFDKGVAALVADPEKEHFDVIELADGRVFERYSRPQRLQDEVVGRVVSFHDVTEREVAARSLKQREEQLAEAQRLAQVGSWELDIRTGTAVLSTELARIFGRSEDDLTPTVAEFVQMVHQEDRGWVTDLLISTSAERAFDCTYRIVRPDGRIRVVHSVGHVVSDADDALTLRGFAQDITEKQELEDEIRQSQKMDAIGRLAGGIAHDLNNVLTTIFGYCQMLSEEATSEDSRAAIAEIEVAATSGAALMSQLLDFSRHRPASQRVFDLKKLLDPLKSLLRSVAREDIALTFRFKAEQATVRMKASQFEQILLNLIINARDAMLTGGEIVVSTSNVVVRGTESFATEMDPGSYILLSVSDTGSGMDRETKDRAFEPFFTTKKEGDVRGTGLGLSIVYGIVRQLGGMVRVESEVGVGTKVHVYLPQTTDQPGSEEQMADVPQALSGNETVLVAEDDRSVRQVVIRSLENLGYTVLEAAHPRDALALSEANPGAIDLLLTDVVMPEMDGPHLVGKVLPSQPNARVLYMSGYPQDLLKDKTLRSGDVAFIPKPITSRSLAEKVRQVLDGGVHHVD